MSKILYIPHYPAFEQIKNRSYIISRELSRYADVYYLQWYIPKNRSLNARMLAQLKNFEPNIQTNGKLNIVNIPLLFWPDNSPVKYSFNEFWINFIISRLNISTVINASMNLLRFSHIKKVFKIYDLVDDHLDKNNDLNIDNRRLNLLTDDIQCADLVTAITEQVRDKVLDRFNIKVLLVHNGVDLTENEFISIPERNKKTKSKLFGFIGNIHKKWVNLNLALDAFKSHLEDYPSDIFRIIGGGDIDYIKELADLYACPQIEFLGPVNENKIYSHFAQIDIGVIPFHINSFTENSLPIKAIEHGCFDSPVISTPVNALKKLSYVYFGTTTGQWQNLYKTLRNDLTHIDKNELQPYIWQDIVHNLYFGHLEEQIENSSQALTV